MLKLNRLRCSAPLAAVAVFASSRRPGCDRCEINQVWANGQHHRGEPCSGMLAWIWTDITARRAGNDTGMTLRQLSCCPLQGRAVRTVGRDQTDDAKSVPDQAASDMERGLAQGARAESPRRSAVRDAAGFGRWLPNCRADAAASRWASAPMLIAPSSTSADRTVRGAFVGGRTLGRRPLAVAQRSGRRAPETNEEETVASSLLPRWPTKGGNTPGTLVRCLESRSSCSCPDPASPSCRRTGWLSSRT